MSEEADVKIGISLDTSKLPEQVKRAEAEIKGAVEGATEAIEAQGAAAEATAEQLEAASSKAAALQRSEAAGVKQMVGESQRAQRQLAKDTREGMKVLGKQISASMKGAAGEITTALKQTTTASLAAGKQVSTSMKAAAGATGGLTSALGVAKGAMDVLSRGACHPGLFNQVVATIKMVMEWWTELQKETITAGQKVANQWRQARQEAENTARMRAPHESLEEQIRLNDRLLEQKREQNAFDAEMAQMKAEREGNRRGVQRAILDGQLARGEISSREHLKGYRKLEDEEEPSAPQSGYAEPGEEEEVVANAKVEDITALLKEEEEALEDDGLVMNAGNPCRAKNPAKCPYHGGFENPLVGKRGDAKSFGLPDFSTDEVKGDPALERVKSKVADALMRGGIEVKTVDGDTVTFNGEVPDHWLGLDGSKKKPKWQRDKRYSRLGDALRATVYPHEIWENGDKKVYIRKYQPKKGGSFTMAGVIRENGVARTYYWDSPKDMEHERRGKLLYCRTK